LRCGEVGVAPIACDVPCPQPAKADARHAESPPMVERRFTDFPQFLGFVCDELAKVRACLQVQSPRGRAL
jgi:hypothetical protein